MPFGWVDFPPSVNRLIGLWWLAKILYPEQFPRTSAADPRFLLAFYHVTPTDAQIDHVLAGGMILCADAPLRRSRPADRLRRPARRAAFAFTVGRYPIGLGDLLNVIAASSPAVRRVPAAVENVIWQVRGPRVIAAVLVGAALAVAGTAFQGLFRNPLVSPDILGASSGAALGAVLGIYLLARRARYRGPAFAGGLVAVAAVYLIGALVPAAIRSCCWC